MKVTDLLARVKWKSVLALILLIAVIILVVWGFYVLKPFTANYKTKGDLSARFWADPARTELRGATTVWVEVKNRGSDKLPVTVTMNTYSKSLLFAAGEQNMSKGVELGPGESRQLPFSANMNASYAGTYGLKAVVSSGGENIEQELFIEAFEAK